MGVSVALVSSLGPSLVVVLASIGVPFKAVGFRIQNHSGIFVGVLELFLLLVPGYLLALVLDQPISLFDPLAMFFQHPPSKISHGSPHVDPEEIIHPE